MSTTLTLSIDELEVESFATAEWSEDAPEALAISQLDTCTDAPNCNPTVNTCEYGAGCWTQYPNCSSGRSVAWGCQTVRCV